MGSRNWGHRRAETCLPSLPSLCSKLGLFPSVNMREGFPKAPNVSSIPLEFLLDTETDQKEGRPCERWSLEWDLPAVQCHSGHPAPPISLATVGMSRWC